MRDTLPESGRFLRPRLVEARDESRHDRFEQVAELRGFFSILLQFLQSRKDKRPIFLVAQKRHRRQAAHDTALEVEVFLRRTYQENRSNNNIVLSSRRESWHDLPTQLRIHNILVNQLAHLFRKPREVDAIPRPEIPKHQLLLPLMGNEQSAQFLSMSVDEQTELRKNGKPDVFGADPEMVMVVVGLDGTVDESVG